MATALDAMLSANHPVKEAAREWADASLPDARAMEGRFVDRAIWKTCAGRGLLGPFVPPSHGGSGLTVTEAMLTFEGLGTSGADQGVTFALASQAVAANRALVLGADDDQAERWLPSLCDGSTFACFALSERQAGSDPSSIQTEAKSVAGGYRLSGTKSWITLAPIADLAVVFAKTDPARGNWGITAFLVDLTADGVAVSPAVPKMGLYAAPFGDIHLDACVVDESAVLGRVGAGAALYSRVLELERAFLCAAQIGAMERILNKSIERSRGRRQGGHHIGSYQAVSHRIVDMKHRHESARLLLYKAAGLADASALTAASAAMVRLGAADAAIASSIDAMRTFGAEGYTTEAGIEAGVRNALGGLAFSGTTDIARNVVASELGLQRARS